MNNVAMSSQSTVKKKPYLAPVVCKPNHEQAMLFLLGHDWNGNPNARTLLELIFSERAAEGRLNMWDSAPQQVADNNESK